MSICQIAQDAAKCARLRHTIGRWAAYRMACNLGVPISIYTLALVLAAAERAAL